MGHHVHTHVLKSSVEATAGVREFEKVLMYNALYSFRTILSNIIIYYHILSSILIYSHLFSYILIYYHICIISWLHSEG